VRGVGGVVGPLPRGIGSPEGPLVGGEARRGGVLETTTVAALFIGLTVVVTVNSWRAYSP
jgi:hypothetical protein